MSKEAFLNSMKRLLGEDYPAFESTLDHPAFRGVYCNTLKCSTQKLLQLFPFPLSPTPFSPNGFYLAPEAQGVGTHPLHHAGAFYVQEPSAMAAAAALGVQNGDKVLDLCAAPGGKTTALAAALGGTGLLWSNEYVKARAFTLLSNCERIGVRNAVVSNAAPAALAAALPAFFDKILVDAPCSGEGMLRREKAEYARWNEKNITLCAARQQSILEDAAVMLAPGGELVYSTCTFNQTENEDVARRFLETHPDFFLLPLTESFGSPAFGLPGAKRIFPKDGGEGHFVVKFRKAGQRAEKHFTSFTAKPAPQEFYTLYSAIFTAAPYGKAAQIGEKIYLLPEEMPAVTGVNLLRAGVLAAEQKGKRLIPTHALFTAAQLEHCRCAVNLPLTDERLSRFLHGEEIAITDFSEAGGYCALAAEGIPLGFGKASGGRLKNHYPKGLRNLT